MRRLVSKLAVAAALPGLLLCPAAARAQGAGAGASQATQAPPPAAAPKDFALPAKHEFTLANGMHVTLVPYGRLPLATVVFDVRTGSIDESADQVWLITIGDDQSTVAGAVLGDSAVAFVRLVASVIQHPSFPDSEFARLKNDRLRQLAIARARPQVMSQERFAAQIYPDHPYGRLYPTEDALKGYTAAQVRDFYMHNLGAARAHLYVVGQFDGAAVEAFMARFNARPRAERTVALIDRPGTVQSTIGVGLPVADPSKADWVALDVTNSLLGGSFGSRITSNIREQKGYTYSPFSFIDAKCHAATWLEGADVTTNVTGASLKEIFGEIDRLRTEAPPADEVRGIQNYLAGTFVLRSSTQAGLAAQFQFVDLHGLGDDYLTSYVRRVYAVTPAEVQRIAQQYLDPNKMAIVVVGDKKTVADQVAPYGKVVQ